MRQFITSTLTITLILFFWSGLTQMLPWGVPSTQNVNTQSISAQTEHFQVEQLTKLEAGSLVTPAFDDLFQNKISTLTTDDSFSWIITKPLEYYNPMQYFTIEILTQFLVAILLSWMLILTATLRTTQRVQINVLGAILAAVAVYGQMMNWWGMPAIYALGASFNLLIGCALASFVSAKWIIKRSYKVGWLVIYDR
ncbi:hypothetical protein [Persicobacter psychrovividus]